MATYTSTFIGPPTVGQYYPGDILTDGAGVVWECEEGGIPGKWVATPLNVRVGVGGTLDFDSGTATAVAGAATLSKMSGKITTESLATLSEALYTLTITNTGIAAADMVFVSVANGTNAQGDPSVLRVTPAAGSVAIVIKNEHATLAFNGTLVVSFFVAKA